MSNGHITAVYQYVQVTNDGKERGGEKKKKEKASTSVRPCALDWLLDDVTGSLRCDGLYVGYDAGPSSIYLCVCFTYITLHIYIRYRWQVNPCVFIFRSSVVCATSGLSMRTCKQPSGLYLFDANLLSFFCTKESVSTENKKKKLTDIELSIS